jgi:hypothetical protein
MSKINDLSNSALRKKFFDSQFVAENNLAIDSIRVSSKKQERGQSKEDQKEINSGYAKRENLKVLKTWSIAETASKYSEMKHFHEMIQFVKSSQTTDKPIKHIIFSFQSRSNRNRYSARDLEDLVDMGVTLHFAREGRKLTCNADSAEWMMWYMENIRNESYIGDLTKNAMGGTIKVIERGMSPVGVPPFGLKAEGRKDKRRWLPHPDKAPYMIKAFEIVIEKQVEIANKKFSDEMLKKELDQLFPKLKKTPDKKQFSKLLRNAHYYGDIVYSGEIYKGSSEYITPLISKEQWCLVQDILENRHKPKRLSKKHPYIGMMNCNGKILDERGKLTDESCGSAITAEKIRRKYKSGTYMEFNYYRCSNSTKRCSQRDKDYMKKVVGHNVSYRQEEIEIIFEDIFKSFSFDEITCKKMKNWLWDEHRKEKEADHARRDELQKRQKELVSFIETSYEDKMTGKISGELWQQSTSRWGTEKEKIATELNAIDDHKDEYMRRGVELIELMQHSEIIYKNATADRKRRLVELVSSNLLLANGSLEYHWNLPFNLRLFTNIYVTHRKISDFY